MNPLFSITNRSRQLVVSRKPPPRQDLLEGEGLGQSASTADRLYTLKVKAAPRGRDRLDHRKPMGVLDVLEARDLVAHATKAQSRLIVRRLRVDLGVTSRKHYLMR